MPPAGRMMSTPPSSSVRRAAARAATLFFWAWRVPEKSIAMAYVEPDCTAVGTAVDVDVRGKAEAARVVPLPFYKRAKA